MARTTREAILTAAAELMRVKGYAAVGMKDIVTASGAPIGSLYHHFPRGKVQIAGEALVNAGRAYALLIPTLVDPHTDLGVALESVFVQAAQDLATTGFANMCPVGTIAGEIADSEPGLRGVAAEVIAGWVESGTDYFARRGLEPTAARELTLTLLSALEGAFILSRTLRSAEPLRATGRLLADQSGYRGARPDIPPGAEAM